GGWCLRGWCLRRRCRRSWCRRGWRGWCRHGWLWRGWHRCGWCRPGWRRGHGGRWMRVYLPATVETLRRLLEGGEIGPAPLRGYAVTPALREWYVDDDLEELEYAALLDAARASLRLLDLDQKAPRRRVVIAADTLSAV